MRDVHRRRQGVVITLLVMLLTASSLLDVAAAGPASIRRTEPPGLQQFMSAIARVESGGRYGARNRQSGAYGKYQIMPRSWRGWAHQYLGNANARPTPRNQELVAEAKLSALYRWLRDWRFVAYWWLTGRREVRTWRWSSYSQRYVNKVMVHFRRGMRAVEAAAAATAAATVATAADEASAQVGPSASPATSPVAEWWASAVQPAVSPAPTATPTPLASPTASPAVAPNPPAAPTLAPTLAPSPSASPAVATLAPSPSASPAVATSPLPSGSPAASPAGPAASLEPTAQLSTASTAQLSTASTAQLSTASTAQLSTASTVAPLRFTYQESSRQISYRGSWIRARFAGYAGGAARYAETVGATATVSFTGRSIAWLGAVGPGRGRARVSVDGKPVRVVALAAGTLDASRPLFRTSWPEIGPHTLTIEVLPSSGGSKVAIDGFEIAR